MAALNYLKEKARHLEQWARLFLTVMKKRPYYSEENDRFVYQKRFNNFNIKNGDIVLDIGSGYYPFVYATILMDLYLGENLHRTRPLLRDRRPLVLADAEYLPYSDKSIDFVYCSHVLEHVENPIRSCSEIMRVGKSGYIETPNFSKDLLFAWAWKTGHRWHTVAINNSLVFFEYSESQKMGINSPAWRELIFAPYHHPLQDAFWKNQNMFNTMLSWENSFDVYVFRTNCVMEKL